MTIRFTIVSLIVSVLGWLVDGAGLPRFLIRNQPSLMQNDNRSVPYLVSSFQLSKFSLFP